MRRQYFHGICSNGTIKRNVDGKRQKSHFHSKKYHGENPNNRYCTGCRNRSCIRPTAPTKKKSIGKQKGQRRRHYKALTEAKQEK